MLLSTAISGFLVSAISSGFAVKKGETQSINFYLIEKNLAIRFYFDEIENLFLCC